MWSASVIATLSLICSFMSGTTAFIAPGTPLARAARGTAPHGTNAAAASVTRQPAQSSRSSGLRMVDQDTLLAGGVALAGVVCGAALVAFTEQQGVRTTERGTISDTTRQRMSAMYMEDDEMPGADVNDVRANLRAALRKNQTAEELAEMTAKSRAKAEEEADDGW